MADKVLSAHQAPKGVVHLTFSRSLCTLGTGGTQSFQPPRYRLGLAAVLSHFSTQGTLATKSSQRDWSWRVIESRGLVLVLDDLCMPGCFCLSRVGTCVHALGHPGTKVFFFCTRLCTRIPYALGSAVTKHDCFGRARVCTRVLYTLAYRGTKHGFCHARVCTGVLCTLKVPGYETWLFW